MSSALTFLVLVLHRCRADARSSFPFPLIPGKGAPLKHIFRPRCRMKVLFGRWVVLATLLWQLGLASELEDAEDDVIEITYNVKRIIEEIQPSSDEDSDDIEDDYDYPHENVDPRNRELIAKEPYRRYRKFQQGWKHHPLYVIILGG